MNNPVYVKLKVQAIENTVALSISGPKENLSLGVTEKIVGGGMLPWYEGSYETTPKIEAQVLETENKSMRSNLTIKAISYSSVSNPSGGETINIAYEE